MALAAVLERVDERVIALASTAVMLGAGIATTWRRNRVFENKLLTGENLAKAEAMGLLDRSSWPSVDAPDARVTDEDVGPDRLTFREREILNDGVLIVNGQVRHPAWRTRGEE